MAKLLMAATAAAALLAPATVRADTLPREVLGKWCVNPEYGQDSATYERCKNKDSDIALEVKQNSAEFYEEDGCRFTSVATRTEMGGGYENGVLRWKSYKVYEVKAKCSGDGSVWSETMFISYYPGSSGSRASLNLQHFNDNELPADLTKDDNKMLCKGDGNYYYGSAERCDGIGLRFERDRYTITKGGEELGFCRLTSVRTVWDLKAVPATKSLGAPVSHITAQCASVTKTLVLYNSKGTWYLEDKGR